tara:strand:- start:6180 stop:6974 length:795 start_codon:yes stop_codon:yes gene_type:complete
MKELQLCDTHCHLDFSEFDACREQLLRRCVALNIRAILVPGVVAAHWPRLLQLCRTGTLPELLLRPALGLHPCFMDQHDAHHLAQLERLLCQHKVAAVGEIGLDFWLPDADREAQIELFTQQLELAKKFRLPVLLHARKSHDQIVQLLGSSKFDCGGIVHAFSGSLQQAEQYLRLGFKLGVGGAVTYPRAKRLQRIVQQLGAGHWVLETDAPDMPLSGRQGQVNRPDYLPEIFAVLLGLLGAGAEELSATLWSNSESVLGRLSD